MRLLRLEGDGLGGRAIDLHPEISVLTDLDDDLRDRLLRACQALPAGEDPGCTGLVEAHGVLLDLDPAALRLLGCDSPLDVVVGREPESEPEDDDGLTTADMLDDAVAELRQLRSELDRAQLEVLGQIEETRAHLDPFARTAFEQAQAHAEREAGLGDVEQAAAAIEDVEPLRERLADIERIERELEEVDRVAVADALALARAEEPDDPEAVEAGRLAVELRQIDTELADLDAALEAQGIHPLELARRRDALSIEVARLESEHAPRTFDPDERAAIEAAHDEVVDAAARVGGSVLGGRGAERKLEEAIEAEQEVLERIGMPTYTAYVMSVTIGSVDAEVEQRLHEVRKELAACQEEYEAATDLLEHDPARTTLSMRQDEIVQRAGELLGRDPGPDVVGALLRFKQQRDAADPVDDLRHQLERSALIEPGLDLEPTEVCDFAAAWLEDMDEAEDEAEARSAEVADLERRLEAVERGRAELEERREAAAAVEPTEELVEARERLERHDRAVEKVAELTELLADVDERRHEIEARMEAQQALADIARSADGGEEEAGIDELDHVLTLVQQRLPAFRDRSFAGSVPMVLHNIVRGVDRDRVAALLGEIEKLADGVQLIILDDDLPVATWATTVGFERAAVVSPE